MVMIYHTEAMLECIAVSNITHFKVFLVCFMFFLIKCIYLKSKFPVFVLFVFLNSSPQQLSMVYITSPGVLKHEITWRG